MARTLPGAGKIIDESYVVTQQELQHSREIRWKMHSDLLDPNQRIRFEQRFAKAAQEHDKHCTAPLARVHAAWLRSKGLNAVFNGHFDKGDINGGLAFSGVVLACVSGTGALGACRSVFEEWFDQPIDQSPLWRAMLLNYQKFLDTVNHVSGGANTSNTQAKAGGASGGAGSTGSTEPQFFSIDDWGNLFNAWNSGASGLEGFGTKSTPAHVVSDKVRTADVLPGLLEELGTLLVARLQKGGRVGKALLAAFGMRSGKPLRWVQVTGTRRDLYTMLMRLSIESQKGHSVSLNHLKVPIENQLNTFRLEGVDLDETKKYWTVAIDTDAQAHLARQGGTAAQRGGSLGKTVKVISVGELKPNVFDLVSHPGVLGGVGLVLSILALRGASSAEATMKGSQGRAKLKITALYGAAASGLIDMTRGGMMAAKGSKIPMLGSWLEDALSKRTLAIWEGGGAAASGASLLILGGIDGYNAFEALSRDQAGLGALYIPAWRPV